MILRFEAGDPVFDFARHNSQRGCPVLRALFAKGGSREDVRRGGPITLEIPKSGDRRDVHQFFDVPGAPSFRAVCERVGTMLGGWPNS
jgi:hypothetical protein